MPIMPVYVDHYHKILSVPKKWQGGGHLIATDLDELHKFAENLGLKRAWYQGGKAHIPHYDLTKNKRDLAIRQGAIVIEPGEIPEGVIRHD